MKMLILLALVLIAVIVLMLIARRSSGPTSTDHRPYRVLETTAGDSVHVFVGRNITERVEIGSVPLTRDDFGERYATLIAQAEDRVTTLNASHELRASDD